MKRSAHVNPPYLLRAVRHMKDQETTHVARDAACVRSAQLYRQGVTYTDTKWPRIKGAAAIEHRKSTIRNR